MAYVHTNLSNVLLWKHNNQGSGFNSIEITISIENWGIHDPTDNFEITDNTSVDDLSRLPSLSLLEANIINVKQGSRSTKLLSNVYDW